MRGILSLLGLVGDQIEVSLQPESSCLASHILLSLHEDYSSSCDVTMTIDQALELRDKLCDLLGDPFRSITQ